MKQYLLSILLVCQAGVLLAQLHDVNWFMGYIGGNDPYNMKTDDAFGVFQLSFASGHLEYSERNNFRNGFVHSNAAFSDSEGNIITVYNGRWLSDKGFKIMKNGDSLWYETEPKLYGYSDDALIQGGFFLSWPDHPDSLLLFYCSKANVGGATGGVIFASRHLQYALIRLSGNNGLGEVTQRRNIVIEDTIQYGMLTAAKHANGRDWWMLINERNSNRFYRLLLDPDGIHLLGQQTVNELVEYGAGGQAVFSPDGKHYAMFHGIDQSKGSYLYVYDFDRCGGWLSNQRIIHFPIATFSGLAFSPNSRYLYQSPLEYVYQYDMEVPDWEASRVTIGVIDTTFFNPYLVAYNQMQLAPDGKIYISGSSSVKNLSVIHAPEEPGLACQMEPHGITLPVHNFASVTSFPHYRLGPLDGSPCDTLGLDNRPVAWYRYASDTLDHLKVAFHDLSYYEPTAWMWDFGDGKKSTERHSTHQYDSAGVYQVCLTVSNVNSSSTHCKTLQLGTSAADTPEIQVAVQVSPNPFREWLSVSLSATLRSPVLHLYDALGRPVREQLLAFGITRVEAGDLAAGMYFWEVTAVQGASRQSIKSGKAVKIE